jgi:3',5'-cyclic AMP phosphodiesterase CpdA
MPTLFHISDLHFGAEDKAALDWFKQEIAREKPDAVICTGDLTMRGTVREFDAAGTICSAWRSGQHRAGQP